MALSLIEKAVQEFIQIRTWAVVGASADPSKFGNKIFKNLTSAGYKGNNSFSNNQLVYGINSKGGEIEGKALTESLSNLKGQTEVFVIKNLKFQVGEFSG
jgi:predicted CoA-binding protein